MSLSVAIVSREYPPFFGGGIGTYTEQFSCALADSGARVVVVTVSGDGEERREERDGLVVARLPFLDGEDWSGPHAKIATPEAASAFRSFSPVSVFAMQVARALPGLVDEFGLDVVEAPDTGALAWFALNERRLGRGCGRRGWPAFVTHLHSPTAWIERWDRSVQSGRAQAELKRMERDVVRWADGLVCPSRGLAVWAESYFELPRGSVEVIRHPLGDLEQAEPREGVRAKGTRRVVYAGRLEPRKGVDVLLAGFARAVERGADLRLDLIGRDVVDVRTGRAFGAMCLERLGSKSVKQRVAVHGAIAPGAVAALRRAGDLAVVPAPNDNFPYSCIEAMAAGLPVVAAKAGGMAEMITGDGDGLLFEPGDVDGCAGALEKAAAMSGVALLAMGRAGRARIETLCGTAAAVRERIGHFERVMRGAGRHVPRRRDDEVVFIGGPEHSLLADAVKAGAGFAHGWVRTGEGVRVFGTPTLDGLAVGPRGIGPLAAARSSLERVRPGVDWRDPWEVAVALAEAEEEGVVVPDCVSGGVDGGPKGAWPVPTEDDAVRLCMELGPAVLAGLISERQRAPVAVGPENGGVWRERAGAAEYELARIKGSRGWRWLTRIYGLLHVLKGRSGRPGESGGEGAA